MQETKKEPPDISLVYYLIMELHPVTKTEQKESSVCVTTDWMLG
jgi:hypothetical protein